MAVSVTHPTPFSETGTPPDAQNAWEAAHTVTGLATVAETGAHSDLSGVGTNTHAQIDTHIASTSNPHSVTATQVGLGNVTNHAQTQAAIVPNTAPSAGQILAGNGTAYAPVSVTGSGATISLSSAGVVTISSIANASLANSSITIAGTSTALGGSITQDTITGLASTGLVKRTGANTLAIAAAGTDYATATNGTNGQALTSNGSGGFGTAVTLATVATSGAHGDLSGVGTNTHAQIDTHIANTSNPHSVTAAQVGLGNVTNHAQTQAAIVPNTVPSAGQILVGNAGGTAYAAVSMSGGATIASTGAVTLSFTGKTTSDLAEGSGLYFTDERAQDAVGTILVDGQTVNLTYNDGTPSITAEVITQMSITSDASGVKLSGDSASPGNSMLYGTNASGVKGWYAQPSPTGGTVDIEDEGVAEGAADTIDFVGAGVSVSFAAGKATVTIAGGSGGIGIGLALALPAAFN